MLRDTFGRQISDLRISVTDRCNFKCFYCKSAHGLNYVERSRLLSYEEIARLARVFVDLGIQKIRITGGEPMLRRHLDRLVESVAAISGLDDLALTTNGFNFYRHAKSFRRLGLSRVTISLDSLQKDRFEQITRSRDFDAVFKSIEAAIEAGLKPVKINCVVVRGINDDEVIDFARLACEREVIVRFIEFMPLDEDEKWSRDKVVTGAQILQQIEQEFSLLARGRVRRSDTARHYDFVDSAGGIGLIMPVSKPFCGACSRIRLTADGKLRTCLFSRVEHDIKKLLRSDAEDEELRAFIQAAVNRKEAGHRINEPDFVPPSRSMSYIGG